MKKIANIGFFLFLAFWVTSAFAYETPVIQPNDYSMQFLYNIFGDVGGLFSSWNTNLPTTGGGGAAGSNVILGMMFEQFNYGISVISIFIFAYIYGKGILDTAAEGQFLGKKANSLWVPIRGILGLILLVPTSAGSGYNIAQVFSMWIVMQGIALADSVWKVTVVALEGGVPATMSAAGNITQLQSQQAYLTTTKDTFKALSCASAMRNYYTDPKNGSEVASIVITTTTPPTITPLTPTYNSNVNVEQFQVWVQHYVPASGSSPQGTVKYMSCGNIAWANMDVPYQDTATTTKRGKYKALARGGSSPPYQGDEFRAAIQASMYDLVDPNGNLYKLAMNYGDTYGATPGTTEVKYPTNATTGYGNVIWSDTCAGCNPAVDSTQQYYGQMVNYVDALVNATIPENNNSSIESDYAGYYNKGWIMAGAYYVHLRGGWKSTGTASNTTNAYAPPELAYPTTDPALVNSTSDPAKHEAYYAYTNADQYFTSLAGASSSLPAGNDLNTTGSSQSLAAYFGTVGSLMSLAAFAGTIYMAMSTLMAATAFVVLGAGFTIVLLATTITISILAGQVDVDPIYLLSVLGSFYLAVAIVLYPTVLITMWATGVGMSVMNSVQPLGEAYQSTSLMLTVTALAAIVGLIGFGALLAVYIPMLYFIYFTVAVMYWFMVILELMIVVVIGVLGIMMPEGQHDLWGMSQATIFLLLNAFLRPTMMIFGLVAAGMISIASIQLISAGFYDAMIAATGQGAGLMNPMTAIFYFMLYITLCITAVSTPLKLITTVPDVCMQGIGHMGQVGQRMESTVGEGKTAFTGGTHAAQAGAQQGSQGAQTATAQDWSKGKTAKLGADASPPPASNPNKDPDA